MRPLFVTLRHTVCITNCIVYYLYLVLFNSLYGHQGVVVYSLYKLPAVWYHRARVARSSIPCAQCSPSAPSVPIDIAAQGRYRIGPSCGHTGFKPNGFAPQGIRPTRRNLDNPTATRCHLPGSVRRSIGQSLRAYALPSVPIFKPSPY